MMEDHLKQSFGDKHRPTTNQDSVLRANISKRAKQCVKTQGAGGNVGSKTCKGVRQRIKSAHVLKYTKRVAVIGGTRAGQTRSHR